MEKNKLLRTLFKLGLTLGLFISLSAGAAFAAAPAAGATLTGTAQSIATSSTAVANNAITVTDANTQEITASNDIRIRIPSAINARWDTTDTTATIGGTEAGTVSTTVSYTGSNILIINVTGGFASANRTVIVSDLKFLGDAASAAANLEWSIDGGTAYGTGNANTALTITATDAAGALTMSNATAGSNGTATLTLTVSVAMAVNDTVTFTAPAELDVSNLSSTTVTGSLDGTTGVMSCTAVAQAVTCTLTTVGDHAAGAGLTIIFPASSVRGAYVASIGNIANLEINDVSATPAGADINSDTTVATPAITVGDLTSTNVQPESLSLSTISPNTFTFVTTAAIPTGAKIVIVYPASWNIAGAASQGASGLSGLTGGWLASVSGQTLTLTKLGGSTDAAGTKTININGVMTPSNEGSGGTYSITTRTSANANIETDEAVTADVIIGKVASSVVIGKPTLLAVTDDAGGGVKLTWTDPASDGTKYISILKGTDPAPVDGSQYAQVDKGKQMYIDTAVKKGDKVTYMLRATDGSTTGALSDPVTFVVGSTVTTTPTTPKTDAAPVTETLTVTLSAVGTSGESGTATITEVAGKAKVVLALKGAAKDVSQPAHIHMGSCAKPGDVKYSLTSALNGASETTLAVSLAELKAGVPLMINVHKSVADVAIYSACGDILMAAAKTDTMTDDAVDTDTDTTDDTANDDAAMEDAGDDDTAEVEEPKITLSDIATSWAKAEITNMVEKGIIKGHPDGTFKPKDKLKRSEAAILLCRVMSFDEKEKVDADPFTDVKKAVWYGSCVAQLKEAEIVKGNPDKTYKPENEINRAEFVALAMRAYGTFLEDDEKTEFDAALNSKEPKAAFKDIDVKKDWFANVGTVAKDNKFVLGAECSKGSKDKCFFGGNSITREEAAAVLDRIFADLL